MTITCKVKINRTLYDAGFDDYLGEFKHLSAKIAGSGTGLHFMGGTNENKDEWHVTEMYPNSESALVAWKYIFEYPFASGPFVWDSSSRIVIAGVCEQHKPTFRQYQQGFNTFIMHQSYSWLSMGKGSYFRGPEVPMAAVSHPTALEADVCNGNVCEIAPGEFDMFGGALLRCWNRHFAKCCSTPIARIWGILC